MDEPSMIASEFFDPALRAISLNLKLGGRAATPEDIAERLLQTLELLGTLDPRPLEWIHVGYSARRTVADESLPRTLAGLSIRVEDGARADDTRQFSPSWGYCLSALGFLAGTQRKVCPFDITISDGEQDPSSSDFFKLRFDQAEVTGRSKIVECLTSLIEAWSPLRGALDGLALAKLHRKDPVLYPPVGVITYFNNNSGYTLPESTLVDLRPLEHGTVAVLKEWTLDANLQYEQAFTAVNEGIPNRRAQRS